MKGAVNVGNLFRFKKVIEKAKKGQEITLGFIGGSITRGSCSSSPKTCYAYLVFKWWESQFPETLNHYVNAGIGATTSQFGVARIEKDLLIANPNLVFVEFSVNDDGNDFFQETFEGLIRKIYGWKSHPAIIVINNMYYDTGKTAQEFHNKVGMAYNLPIVSIKDSLYQDIKKGKYQVKQLTSDMLHPNDFGHELIGTIICEFLGELKILSSKEWIEKKMPVPVTRNRFERSRIINKETAKAEILQDNFLFDRREQLDLPEIFKNGWYAVIKGAYIEIEVFGKNIAIQYRKSIQKPAPVASVFIDNRKEAILDGNHEENWGDCLFLQTIATDLVAKKHKVRIVITDVDKNNATPFYLVALIVS